MTAPQRRFALAGLLALAALVALFFAFARGGDAPPASQAWPYTQEDAPQVSLSFAWARLTGDTPAGHTPAWALEAVAVAPIATDQARLLATLPPGAPNRAGVLGDHLYLAFGPTTVRAQLPFPSAAAVQDLLLRSEVELVIYANARLEATLTDRLFQLLPIAILIGILLFVLARGATKSLGLSSAFVLVPTKDLHETFADVAGIDGARAELDDVVGFLRDPKAAGRLGARMPKGVLFAGPPGTGKTLLARALAKEAGVPFLAIEASGVNQIFVGAGAMKIRRAFHEARKRAPCIVFIDEIDALGRARGGSSASGAGEEKDATLNALLVELDGMESRAGIVLVAATNRPDVLDPALVRRGRIDRRVDMALPSIAERAAILRVHMGKIATDPDLSEDVARLTFGMAGADLGALVNEAALLATRRGASTTELADYQQARDKFAIGAASSHVTLTGEERRLVAFHEAGHALVAACTPGADPIERVTIVPQGPALGHVAQRPQEDRRLMTRQQLDARLDVALAGRAAEIALLGPGYASNGAESDVLAATRIAALMAGRWGMGASGFAHLGADSPLDRDSQALTRDTLDILDTSRARVARLIDSHKEAVDALATYLLTQETLTGQDAIRILAQAGAPIVGLPDEAHRSGTDTKETTA